MELVNPEITMKKGEQRGSQGCLSLPGKYGVTVRPMKVQVKAQDRNGKWQVFTGEGLKARAFAMKLTILTEYCLLHMLLVNFKHSNGE